MLFDMPTAEEYPLIFDSWARCWHKSPWAGCVRNCDYDTVSRAMINEIIDRKDTRVSVLYTVTEGGARRVMGYSVSEPSRHVLHWLYVKRDFRGVGIGYKLLADVLGPDLDRRQWTYTHKTSACDKFLRGLKHAPQHARVKV